MVDEAQLGFPNDQSSRRKAGRSVLIGSFQYTRTETAKSSSLLLWIALGLRDLSIDSNSSSCELHWGHEMTIHEPVFEPLDE